MTDFLEPQTSPLPAPEPVLPSRSAAGRDSSRSDAAKARRAAHRAGVRKTLAVVNAPEAHRKMLATLLGKGAETDDIESVVMAALSPAGDRLAAVRTLLDIDPENQLALGIELMRQSPADLQAIMSLLALAGVEGIPSKLPKEHAKAALQAAEAVMVVEPDQLASIAAALALLG
jgi:hypothetical protein